MRDTLESGADSEEADDSDTRTSFGASGHELIREKDFAEMTPEEFERVRKLMAPIAQHFRAVVRVAARRILG